MTRLQQVVLWTVAVFVFGYVGFRFLIIEASTIALAQSPAVNESATNFDSPPIAQQQQGAQSDEVSVHQADPVLEDKPSPASLPEPAVDGPIISYSFKTPDFQNDVLKLKEQFARRANIDLDSHSTTAGVPSIIVRAPAEVQEEIRAVIHYLTKQGPAPASTMGQPQSLPPTLKQTDKIFTNTGDEQERTLVAYRIRNVPARNIASVIEAQFSGRATVVVQNSTLVIRTTADTHSEIRGVINLLDNSQSISASALPASADGWRDNSPGKRAETSVTQQPFLHDYFGLRIVAQQAAQDRIQAARNQLSTSTTDEDRAVARAQLRRLLTEVFAQDMQARQNQAKDIETRLAKLQKQYQDREQSRDKIIDLQLQVLEQDAAGLGFPQTQSAQPGKSSDAIYQRTSPSPARLHPAPAR